MEKLIVREIAERLHRRKTKDDRIGFVSVVRCDLLPDLSEARIYFSLFGSEQENRSTWRALMMARRELQSGISRDLRLRQTPLFVFRKDDSIREGDRILEQIQKEELRRSGPVRIASDDASDGVE
jgi:ribosome-binding factor A